MILRSLVRYVSTSHHCLENATDDLRGKQIQTFPAVLFKSPVKWGTALPILQPLGLCRMQNILKGVQTPCSDPRKQKMLQNGIKKYPLTSSRTSSQNNRSIPKTRLKDMFLELTFFSDIFIQILTYKHCNRG